MTLTTKQMDEINFLLTEVSLELLGNKFYDITGQCRPGLTELYATNLFSTLPTDYEVYTSDLVKALNVSDTLCVGTKKPHPPTPPLPPPPPPPPPPLAPSSVRNDTIKIPPITFPKQQQQQKLYPAITDRRQSTGDDSLLIPMKKTRPIAAAVRQRRKTLFDVSSRKKSDLDKNLSLTTSLSVSTTAATTKCKNNPFKTPETINYIPKSGQKITVKLPPVSVKNESQLSNSKVHLMKEKISAEFIRMKEISDKNKEDYFLKSQCRMESDCIDEFDIVDEFYKKELDTLTSDSGVLIQFVKFIRSDPKHEPIMQEIAKNILLVKDEM